MNAKKKIIIIDLILLLSCISFAFIPVTGDIKVFLASSNQSSYISKNLFVGAFSAWELKSVYARSLFYFLYQLASCVFTYGTMSFELFVKMLYLMLIVACSILCSNLIYGRPETKTVEGMQRIKLIIIAFTAMHTASHLQTEMTCAMLSLIAFAIWINARRTAKKIYIKLAIAGLLIGSIAFYKSALILMAVSVVMAVYIYCKKIQIEFRFREVFFVAFVSAIAIILSILLIKMINPSELKEIFYASAYQSTLLSVKIEIMTLVKRAILLSGYNIFYIPAGVLGIVAFIINTYHAVRNHKGLLVMAHVLMWSMPWLFIILSNQYFAYHFAVFIFTAIVEFMSLQNDKAIHKYVLSICGLPILIFYVFFFSILSPNSIDSIKYDIESYDLVKEELKGFDIDEDEEILFLDSGLGAYYLKNKSYSKYFFPLPLQRLGEESEIGSAEELFEEIKEYKGSYIVVDEEWFFDSGKNPTIQKLLEEKYEFQCNMAGFSPSWDYKLRQSKIDYCKLYKLKLNDK